MKSFSAAEQEDDSNLKMEGGGRTQGVSTNFVPTLKKKVNNLQKKKQLLHGEC